MPRNLLSRSTGRPQYDFASRVRRSRLELTGTAASIWGGRRCDRDRQTVEQFDANGLSAIASLPVGLTVWRRGSALDIE
ncbi:hypothetical protein AY599_22585 [Leptolyngbya valderiana BDU 20041]|nr:hypothetical protein [Geitlerinema sp. CS-897]OAB59894.1 hypothetical protein AY599_22585 [Leptolyngbya valderiana BDU 20041]PPT05625.1 hypothetical protein CKA32_002280 [Geitlerinema sp. FC II]